MAFAALKINFSVLGAPNIYNPSYLLTRQTAKTGLRFSKVHEITRLQFISSQRQIAKFSNMSPGNQYHYTRFRTKTNLDPFWLTFIKDTLWGCRSLVLFLFEQPSQLKYIEWPSFPSTLKIATLTIVIVAVLLVLLSSTDAALSFVLALMLKKRG